MSDLKLRITAKLETSDHDGYCSEGECEYKVIKKSYVVDLPDELIEIFKGTYDDISDKLNELDELDFDWETLLPRPDINRNGSYWCERSSEVSANNLERHTYKYTISSVKIIDIPIGDNDKYSASIKIL
jgi:hypothetical protein